MNLWCQRHCENHRLTPGEVERAFYALQGMLADAETDPAIDYEPQLVCPIGMVILAADVDGYAEHVSSQREQRLEAERIDRGRAPE